MLSIMDGPIAEIESDDHSNRYAIDSFLSYFLIIEHSKTRRKARGALSDLARKIVEKCFSETWVLDYKVLTDEFRGPRCFQTISTHYF
jgi:hypothetical protein